MNGKEFVIPLFASILLGTFPAFAQMRPDPTQAAINQAQGIGNPVSAGSNFSKQSEDYLQQQNALIQNEQNGEYDKDAEIQAQKYIQNNEQYQNSGKKLEDINKETNFENRQEPDTGVFSRIMNQEKKEKHGSVEKNLDNSQTPSVSTPNSQSPNGTLHGTGHAIDALTISVGGGRIILTGLKAYGNDASCTINDNYVWPCGNEGRAAVEQIVSHTDLFCKFAYDQHGTCYDRQTGEAIQKRIVRTGFALPYGKEGLNYEDDLAYAKKHHLGIFQDTQ